jgi:hypothetical protein
VAALVAGCSFESRPGGGTPDGGVDGAIDASDGGGGPVAEVCYGPPGAWRVCLREMPRGSVTLPAVIDTDKTEVCQRDQPVGWMPAQREACFVVGDVIMTPQQGTRVLGRRPLVLVAHTSIAIDSALDFAGRQAENNLPTIASPEAPCQPFGRQPADENAGGGGAGGSFITRAGNGGAGGNGAQNGQAAAEDRDPPARLRGGCPGQVGGRRDGDLGAGRGGGAIYLLAGTQIAVSGTVNASGAGGSGGGQRSGGSGGGSGGMIVLHASSLGISGVLLANGGGGAGGGLQDTGGVSGLDPSALQPLQPAVGGANGGDGFPAVGNAVDATSGPASNDGGGGGGGGAGYIRANQALGANARVSPAPRIADQ